MTENHSTAGSAIPEELGGVQAQVEQVKSQLDQLDQMMGGADDKTKRQIFKSIICHLAKALPESDSFIIKEPKPISAGTKNLLDAGEKLREAACLAEFVQSISLNAPPSGEITLYPAQLTGFYFVMKQAIDRIQEAGTLINKVRAEPEALPV